MSFSIEMNGFMGWECKVCKVAISSVSGEPISKYWNVERKEVYCGAAHSLQRHEELNPRC